MKSKFKWMSLLQWASVVVLLLAFVFKPVSLPLMGIFGVAACIISLVAFIISFLADEESELLNTKVKALEEKVSLLMKERK